MRRSLRLVALLVIAGAVTWWVAAGAPRGWSKNTVEVRSLDEITGIEKITYDDRFVPGVDTLALGVAAAAILAGLSCAFDRKPRSPKP